MGSALVAVRKGLVDKIRPLVSTGDTGVETTFAFKTGTRRRERLWTQDARFTHAPASLRATKTFREETGRFSVVILIEGVGLDPLTVSARAMEVGLVVEDLVAIHATWQNSGLGVPLIDMVVEGDGALVEAFNDKGSLAELTIPIRYRARLT